MYLQGFTKNLGKTFFGSIKGKRILFHFTAILLTISLVMMRLDWSYFAFFQDRIFLQIFLFPAVMIGGFTPLIFPPIIYLYAKHKNQPYLEPIALGLTRIGVAALFWSALYKSITGRIQPEIFEELDRDYSQDFAFGILQRGVFHGWPSGHASVAFAMATFYYFYQTSHHTKSLEFSQDRLKYRKFGYLAAFYIALGVSTNIHWFSDAIAGILIGISVGLSGIENSNNDIQDRLRPYSKEFFITFIFVFLVIIFSVVRLEDY